MENIEKTFIFIKIELLEDNERAEMLEQRIAVLSVKLPQFTSIDAFSEDGTIINIPDESKLDLANPDNYKDILDYIILKLQSGYILTTQEDICLKFLTNCIK